MIEIKLEAFEHKRLGTSSAITLICRQSSAFLFINSDLQDNIRIESGDVLDVTDLDEITLLNPHNKQINFIVQLVNRRVKISPKMDFTFPKNISINNILDPVSVSNIEQPLIIDEIKKPLTLEYKAKEKSEYTKFYEHVELNAGQKKRLIISNANRTELFISNISIDYCEIMIAGGDVSLNCGFPLSGCRAQCGSISLNTTGEVFALNTSEKTAKLTFLETYLNK